MRLAEVFDERLIKLNLTGTDKGTVFEELVEEISAFKPDLNQEEMLAAIGNREAKMNTSVAPGVAVPHGYVRGLNGIIGAVGFSRQGIEYKSQDSKPVHLVFMVLLGDGAQEQHLRVLSRILTFVK
ncbi:MAG: PTS sugar transporter subunit IIA, partial [Spirochaetaceae bacterium]|nr:PTS sugar transporter subunit IIA [Spirochaetaceae bacterium]